MFTLLNIQSLISCFALFLAYLVVVTVTGFTASLVIKLMGDDTPEQAGLLTLDPMAHVDPIGIITLIIFGIGWGRTIPIDPQNISGTLRLTVAYLASSLVYISLAVISLCTVIKLFGVQFIYVIQAAITDHFHTLSLLYKVYPEFSSSAIASALVLLSAVSMCIMLSALDMINHGFRLVLLLFFPDLDLQADSQLMFLFIPLILMLVFIEPLINLIKLVVTVFGYYSAQMLGA